LVQSWGGKTALMKKKDAEGTGGGEEGRGVSRPSPSQKERKNGGFRPYVGRGACASGEERGGVPWEVCAPLRT